MDIQMQAIPMLESVLETPNLELRANRKTQDVDAIRMAVLQRIAFAGCENGEPGISPVYCKPN